MYITGAQFYCPFDATSVVEQVTGYSLAYTGNSPVVVPGVFGNALQLSESTYLTNTHDSNNLSITSAFTIGFWLNPVSRGLVAHSGSLVPLRMPVLTKANFSYSTMTGVTSLSAAQFTVYETTQGNNQNCLNVFLQGALVSFTATTPSYTAGIFHHFWITYNGSSLIIFVDGIAVSTTTSGTLPAVLNVPGSLPPLEINNTIDGSSYNVSRNTGALDDLFILNTFDNSQSDVVRAMKFGAPYVIDTTFNQTYETYIPAIVNEIGTVQVNSVADDNANLYVGKSDGNFTKGQVSLWQFSQPATSVTGLVRV